MPLNIISTGDELLRIVHIDDLDSDLWLQKSELRH